MGNIGKIIPLKPRINSSLRLQEIHASHVESTLLSQVRVAAIGQEIDVWVLGRTRVRLRVGKLSFSPEGYDHSLVSIVSLEPSNGKALLLTTSTEVSIAPKTRSTRPNGPTLKSNGRHTEKLPSSLAQPSTSRTQSDVRTKPLVFRVLPKRVIPPISPLCSALDDGIVAAIVFVSRMDLRQMSQLRLQDFCDVVDNGKCWNAVVHRLTPPENPDHSSGTANIPTPTPKVLVPTDGKTSALIAPSVPKDEVLLVWSPHVSIPDGSAIVHGSLSGVEDYDNLRVSMKDVSKHIVEYETPHIGSVSGQ